jgi:hypothetical protein
MHIRRVRATAATSISVAIRPEQHTEGDDVAIQPDPQHETASVPDDEVKPHPQHEVVSEPDVATPHPQHEDDLKPHPQHEDKLKPHPQHE